jgi:hypothetical protein
MKFFSGILHLSLVAKALGAPVPKKYGVHTPIAVVSKISAFTSVFIYL